MLNLHALLGYALQFAFCSVYTGVLALLLRGGPAPPRPAKPLRSRPHHVHQHYRRLHFKQVLQNFVNINSFALKTAVDVFKCL